MNQLAVGQAVQAGGGADALNPQAAILAFLDAAVALGVAIGAIRGFLCGLVELVRKKPFVLLRYFLRRARRLVPRFTRAMGFSFDFV